MYEFKTSGTCSQRILFDIEDGKVRNVKFIGGCNGNLKGIAALAKGQKISDVKQRLTDITCGGKSTSCPDQFAQLLAAVENK